MGWTAEATMRTFPESGFLESNRAFEGDVPAKKAMAPRKKKRRAYLAWLCLGSHYLYLGKPITQALFWLSLGGLLVWWIRDCFRLPALVALQNRRAGAVLASTTQESLEQGAAGWGQGYEPPSAPAPASPQISPWGGTLSPQHGEAAPSPSTHATRREFALGAGSVLAALAVATLAIYAFTPPPLHSRALLEPSFRTLRTVNVRASPSTRSPIRSAVRKNVVLKGQVEKVGGQRWLWITRGRHSDGYVALQNLEKQ